MKKQDILNLEGTIIDEEELMKLIESQFVIEVASYGYSKDEDFISYAVTLDDGTEIELYSYY